MRSAPIPWQQHNVATVKRRTAGQTRCGETPYAMREGSATRVSLMSVACAGQSQVPLRPSRLSAPSLQVLDAYLANSLLA